MDKSVSDAVELLYKGAKMLAQHCLDCKMPLFKYEGKVLCPSCKREFKIDEKGNVEPLEEKKEKKEEKKKEFVKVKFNDYNEYYNDISQLKNILKSKLYILIKDINNCNDINKLDYYINLSLKMLDLIDRLDRMVSIGNKGEGT